MNPQQADVIDPIVRSIGIIWLVFVAAFVVSAVAAVLRAAARHRRRPSTGRAG